MRRRLWMLAFAALSGAFASFFVVDENYVLGAIMGAIAGLFVLVFIRAWPHDLDPRERNGKLVINVNVDGRNIPESRYDKRARSGRP
ncbi:MAG: hypothetical protein ACREHE_12325 [Rhizomicrobium sp.]